VVNAEAAQVGPVLLAVKAERAKAPQDTPPVSAAKRLKSYRESLLKKYRATGGE